MSRFNQAQRRYNKRVIGLSLLYALFLVSAVWLFRHDRPSGALAWLVAILPALPLFGIFVAMGRYLVEESDEYLRAMETRKSLIATGFMLIVTTGWGFLQSFELAPHVDFYWAAILWFAGLGVGGCVQRLSR
jgi:Kef-type K+ transport system membrane component KefB